jgi:hypothetical protein
MKIHLIRSEEVNTEWYHELLRYLRSFPGPMEFISSDEVPTFEFDEDLKEDWSNTKREVELIQRLIFL